jgi:hypothetical protein
MTCECDTADDYEDGGADRLCLSRPCLLLLSIIIRRSSRTREEECAARRRGTRAYIECLCIRRESVSRSDDAPVSLSQSGEDMDCWHTVLPHNASIV